LCGALQMRRTGSALAGAEEDFYVIYEVFVWHKNLWWILDFGF